MASIFGSSRADSRLPQRRSYEAHAAPWVELALSHLVKSATSAPDQEPERRRANQAAAWSLAVVLGEEDLGSIITLVRYQPAMKDAQRLQDVLFDRADAYAKLGRDAAAGHFLKAMEHEHVSRPRRKFRDGSYNHAERLPIQ